MRANEAHFRENLKLQRQAIVTDLGRLIRQQQLEEGGTTRRCVKAATPQGLPTGAQQEGSPWAYEQGNEAPLTPPMVAGLAMEGPVVPQEAAGLHNVATPKALDWLAYGSLSTPTAGCLGSPGGALAEGLPSTVVAVPGETSELALDTAAAPVTSVRLCQPTTSLAETYVCLCLFMNTKEGEM